MKIADKSLATYIFTLVKIFFVLIVVGLIGNFILNKLIERRVNLIKRENKIKQTQNLKAFLESNKENAVPADGLDNKKTKAFNECMNKVYDEYKISYQKECSKRIIDGKCQISQEKLRVIQGYYEFDKNKCEELNK